MDQNFHIALFVGSNHVAAVEAVIGQLGVSVPQGHIDSTAVIGGGHVNVCCGADLPVGRLVATLADHRAGHIGGLHHLEGALSLGGVAGIVGRLHGQRILPRLISSRQHQYAVLKGNGFTVEIGFYLGHFHIVINLTVDHRPLINGVLVLLSGQLHSGCFGILYGALVAYSAHIAGIVCRNNLQLMSTGRNVLNGHNKCTGGEIHALDGLPVEGNDHIHQLVVVRNLYGILHSVAHLRGAGISGDGHDRCVGILNDYGLGGFGNITGSIRNNKLDFVHIEIGGVKVISAVAVNGHFLTIDGQNRTLHCNVILYGDRQGAIASIADGRAAIDGSGGADVILTDNLEYGNGLGLISSRIPDYCLEGDVLHTLIIQTVAIGGVDIGHSLGQGHFHPILIEDNLSHCHVVLGFQCDGDGITHNHFCIAQLNGSRGTLGVRYAGDDFLCGAGITGIVLHS